jgi:hypothetical protein
MTSHKRLLKSPPDEAETGILRTIFYTNANIRLQQLESGSMKIQRDDYSQGTITWGNK